jgi:hypothetical protein
MPSWHGAQLKAQAQLYLYLWPCVNICSFKGAASVLVVLLVPGYHVPIPAGLTNMKFHTLVLQVGGWGMGMTTPSP